MSLQGMQERDGYHALRALKRFFLATVLILAALCAPPAYAGTPTNYYVSTSGNDTTGTGSSAKPWATVQKAASVVLAGANGAIVNIEPGVYSNTSPIQPAHSGTSTAAIAYQGMTTSAGSPVILIAPFQINSLNYITIKGLSIQDLVGYDGIDLTNANNITIDSVSIQNISTNSSFQGGAGILAVGCSNLTVQNCYTHETQQTGIGVWGMSWPNYPGQGSSATFPSQNVYIHNNVVDMACDNGYNECIDIANGVENATVDFNTVTDSTPLAPLHNAHGGEGIDVKLSAWNVWIAHNQVFNIGRMGMQIDGASYPNNSLGQGQLAEGTNNIYVFDNVIHDIPAGGINIESEPGGLTSGQSYSYCGPNNNVQIENNLVYNNSGDGVCLLDYNQQVNQPVSDILIANNTVWNNNSGYRNQSFSGVGGIDVAYTGVALNPSVVQILDNVVGGSSSNSYYQLYKWAIAADHNGISGGYYGCATVQNNVIDTTSMNTSWFGGLTSPDTGNHEVSNLGLKNVATLPYDFHLASTSPAVGAGALINDSNSSIWPYAAYFASDFAGNARLTTGSCDAGAYNYAASYPFFLLDGVYCATNMNSNKTLDDPAGGLEGTQMDQYDFLDNANERWLVRNLPNSGFTNWSGYNSISALITSSGYNYPLYAGVNGSVSAGAPVKIENYSSSNTDQQWSVTTGGSGYDFVNEKSGLYLDVSGNSTSNNAKIVQQTSGQAGENFALTPLSGGSYQLIVTLGTVSGFGTDVRNNFAGWVGYEFTVPTTADPSATPITVTQLGRWVYENSNPTYFPYPDSQTHTVALFDSTGNELGSVSINCSTWTPLYPEGFDYAPLSSPIQLKQGATYYIASWETTTGYPTSGGDPWYNDTTTFVPTWGSVLNSAYSSSTSSPYSFSVGTSGDNSYGPVDFWYQ